MPDPAAQKAFISRCAVNLRVGVRDAEKANPQRVIVSIEAETALTRLYRETNNADLSAVIDYSALHDYVTKELPGQNHISLLETIAQQIIDFAFTDPLIDRVNVRLEKPDIYKDTESAGIEMSLSREEYGKMK